MPFVHSDIVAYPPTQPHALTLSSHTLFTSLRSPFLFLRLLESHLVTLILTLVPIHLTPTLTLNLLPPIGDMRRLYRLPHQPHRHHERNQPHFDTRGDGHHEFQQPRILDQSYPGMAGKL